MYLIMIKTENVLVHNIKRLMQERGWKALDLSKATGISRTGLYSILNENRSMPRPENLEQIAKALDVQVWTLLKPGGVETVSDSPNARLLILDCIKILLEFETNPEAAEEMFSQLLSIRAKFSKNS